MRKGTHPTNRPKVSLSARQGTVMGIESHLTKKETELPFSGNWAKLPKKQQDRLLLQATKEAERNKKRLAR